MKSALTSRREFSPAKQLLLEKRLQGAMLGPSRPSVIARCARDGNLPLSFAQQRLWFLDQLIPGSPVYNISETLRLRGKLNVSALEWSLGEIVRRHESLRTTFRASDGQPIQVITSAPGFVLPKIDLQHLSAADREKEMLRIAQAESKKPFDLSRDLMIRAALVRLDSADHVLLVTMHHIVSDAWSLGVFYEELGQLYAARVGGQSPNLPELPIQYADYSVWQRQWLQNSVLDEQLGYWKEQLAGAPDFLELPIDKTRPAVQSFRGGSVTATFPASLAKAVKQLSRQEGVTLFMTLLATFDALLSRYSRQTDILVGSPIAGRTQLEAEELIGLFVNTLVLRTDLSGNPTFRELLQRVRKVTLDAYAHQDLPLEKLVMELKPERSTSHSPLFQVMFVLQNAPAAPFNLPGLSVTPMLIDNETAKFDLILSVTDTGDELSAGIEYNEDIFEARTISRMLGHLRVLLEGAVAHPEHRVAELPMLTDEERNQLLVEWNDTRTEYPRGRTIPELFEEQAARTPQAVAVSFDGTRLSYAELNERANRWAHLLRRSGVRNGSPVGLSMERSVEMIVGLVAILKAGGAYVSLDPSYPRERLALMIEDVNPVLILTQQKLRSLLSVDTESSHPRIICMDEEEATRESSANLSIQLSPENLAYISFTSGSTGRPKGVCVPHRAVVRLVRNTNYITIGAKDVFLQLAPIAFDASTLEIWGCLLNGAKLVVFPPELPALSDLAETIERDRVSILWLTSGLFQQMVDEHLKQLRSVRQLLAGGDVLSMPHAKKALEGLPLCRLVNGYGPTENTTFTCCHIISEASFEHRSLPIGRPISNTRVYVLDAGGNLVPVGVPGELYVAGDGLATGYLKRDELTAEKFVSNPQKPDERLYKTGDLVHWLPNGELEFLGRLDQQVKIRGFRVEPAEIEQTIAQHPKIRECVVVVHQDATVGKRLIAYFVSHNGAALSIEELREFVRGKLPDYMMPAFFIALPTLPLNANGKVDRKGLPPPEQSSLDAQEERISPRDSLEKELAQLWERVLGVSEISIRKSFFELGGHSLLAVQLVAQIEKTFGKKISVAAVFQAPTVEQLAAVLRGCESQSAGSSLVGIQPKGSRPPLFLIHGVGGGMFWGYTNLSRHLGPDQPVYALKSRAMDGGEEFETIEEMAAQYLADIRTIQPRGPYNLGGYCFGGNVAYEMARQLREAGEEIGFVALINCGPPNSSYGQIRFTPSFVWKFLKNLRYWARNSLAWTPAQRQGFIRWKMRSAAKRVQQFLRRKQNGDLDVDTLVDLTPYPEEQRRLWEAHIRALIRYHPRSYPGKVTLFRSPGHQLLCSFDEQYGWGEFALGGVAVKIISGAHEQILEEPHVKRVAEEMTEGLNGAREVGRALRCAPESANCIATSNGAEPRRGTECMPNPASGNGKPNRSEVAKLREERTPPSATLLETDLAKPYSILFEEQVRRTPSAVAVRFGSQQLTYEELNERANQLAHYLKDRGLGPEKLAAIYTERSLEFAVAILAAFKTGGAILPLDPAYPRERLEWMLEDSQALLLLSFRGLSGKLPVISGAHVICLDDPAIAEAINLADPNSGPVFQHSSDDLAYVIYTSGSTGRPKGVEVPYRALLSHNFAITAEFALSPHDTVLQFTPLSFDISIEEILPSWLAGAKVVFRNKEVLGSISKFLSFVEREQITVLNLPTAFFHALVEALSERTVSPSVRLVIIGGESVSAEAWEVWQQRVPQSVQLINAYGLTEATVTSTIFRADGKPGRKCIPIGRPIRNTTVQILDEQLNPVPVGATGELFIGGMGLARGFRNSPELTHDRFLRVSLPSDGSSRNGSVPERLYRTGDLTRLSPDGNIEFLGRADDLVKLRGFRIQLGEIETALAKHPAIAQAIVQPAAFGDREPRLVAYFMTNNSGEVTPGQLIRFLQQTLPEYMIPSAFVRLEAFPLTPSGKVDRNALPLPGTARPALSEPFVAPRTSLEEKIAGVWREVLHLDEVGVNDNFFDLGGHSLHAMQVMGRLRDVLNVELPVSDLFEAPTVARLSEAVGSNDSGSCSNSNLKRPFIICRNRFACPVN